MPFLNKSTKKAKTEEGSLSTTQETKPPKSSPIFTPFKKPAPAVVSKGPWLTSAAVTKLLGRVDEVAGKVEELMDLLESVLPPADLTEEDDQDTGGDTEELTDDELEAEAGEASQAV